MGRPIPRRSRTWRLFGALIAAAAIATLLGPSKAALQSQRVPLGPPIRSDASSLDGGGFRTLAHLGGHPTDFEMEAGREVAWIAAGPRVHAFDVHRGALRPSGRSPALPGVVSGFAADNGRVLARTATRPARLWLIDGHNPTHLADVRPLVLDEEPRAMDVHGGRGVVVTGERWLLIDLARRGEPVVLQRGVLADFAPDHRIRQVELSSNWVAFVFEDGRLFVRPIAYPDVPATELIAREAINRVRLSGERVLAHAGADLWLGRAPFAGGRLSLEPLGLRAGHIRDYALRDRRLIVGVQVPESGHDQLRYYEVGEASDSLKGSIRFPYMAPTNLTHTPKVVMLGADSVHALTIRGDLASADAPISDLPADAWNAQ